MPIRSSNWVWDEKRKDFYHAKWNLRTGRFDYIWRRAGWTLSPVQNRGTPTTIQPTRPVVSGGPARALPPAQALEPYGARSLDMQSISTAASKQYFDSHYQHGDSSSTKRQVHFGEIPMRYDRVTSKDVCGDQMPQELVRDWSKGSVSKAQLRGNDSDQSSSPSGGDKPSDNTTGVKAHPWSQDAIGNTLNSSGQIQSLVAKATKHDSGGQLDVPPQPFVDILTSFGIIIPRRWRSLTLAGEVQALAVSFAKDRTHLKLCQSYVGVHMVNTRHKIQDQILSNEYPSIRYQINLLSYLLENRPLGVSVPDTLDYCNFFASYRLIVDGINLGEVGFGSVENCISNGVSLFHTQAAAKRITATKVLHGGKPSPVILWSREAQLVAAVANVAALLQFSHVWCKIPSGGGYANYIWRPRKQLQPNSKATRRAITEARIQERSSKGQHGIIKSFEATQQMTRNLALYVLLLSIGVALSYITFEGFVDSNTVRATLAWDTNNEHHTSRDYACSKKNCQGHVLTLIIYFAHFSFEFMLTSLTVFVISKIKHIIEAEGLILTSEIPGENGRTRVRWTCSCGYASYDDFEKLGAGAAKEMQRSLMSIEGKSRSRPTNGESGRSQGQIAKSVGCVGGYLKWIWPPWKLRENTQGLPTHTAPQHRHASMLKLKLLVWTKSLRSCGRSFDCIRIKGLGSVGEYVSMKV
ncbi:MAG: hypothetical protein Q9204_004774 [Flavoplaca sp. TL-2023a]